MAKPQKIREVVSPMLEKDGKRLIPSFGFAFVRVKRVEKVAGSNIVIPTGETDPRGRPMAKGSEQRDRWLVELYVIDPGEGFVLLNGEIRQPLHKGDRVYLRPGKAVLEDEKLWGKDVGLICIEDVMCIERTAPRAVN